MATITRDRAAAQPAAEQQERRRGSLVDWLPAAFVFLFLAPVALFGMYRSGFRLGPEIDAVVLPVLQSVCLMVAPCMLIAVCLGLAIAKAEARHRGE